MDIQYKKNPFGFQDTLCPSFRAHRNFTRNFVGHNFGSNFSSLAGEPEIFLDIV